MLFTFAALKQRCLFDVLTQRWVYLDELCFMHFSGEFLLHIIFSPFAFSNNLQCCCSCCMVLAAFISIELLFFLLFLNGKMPHMFLKLAGQNYMVE